jgi:competence ComEA-like helix-hairpin-helix protein
MADRIDLNTASAKEMTRLPGIAKNLAYKIAEHRSRHGWFTAWEELLRVKGFPSERLDEIKQRAILSCPEDRPGQTQTECTPPRHLNAEKIKPRTGGYTRKLRTTRGKDRSHDSTGHPRAA